MERKVIAQGIDVSAHQGRMDFNKIASWRDSRGKGLDFVILRAGYGRGNYGAAEPFIHKHINEAHANGLDVGLYWFCYAQTEEEARAEARELIDIANQHKGQITYPLCFDLEYDTDEYANTMGRPLNRQMRTAMTKAFCDECEKAGYYALFYTNEDYLQNKLNQNELLDVYDLWQAAPFQRGKLHQLNIDSEGYVNVNIRPQANIWQAYWWLELPGIRGSVADFNLAFVDYPNLIKHLGLNGFEKPMPINKRDEKQKEYAIEIPCATKAEAEMLLSALRKAKMKEVNREY